MKKISILSIILSVFGFSSCQFNQSVKKDLVTGAFSKTDGIGCEKIAIVIDGKVVNRNEFIYGEKVNLVFNDLNGLTKFEQKTYPGLSIHIVKDQKDTILSNPDLLKNVTNGTELSPLQLKASFVAAFPNQNSKNYKAYVEIWDKKGNGRFSYELPFTVKENELLDIESNNIKYTNIYLWNKTIKQPVFNKNINQDHQYVLIFEGIEGLDIKNDKVFPIFSIEIMDSKRNKILSKPNMLSKFENEGIKFIDVKNQLKTTFNFSKGEINNPYTLNAIVKDRNSSNQISIKIELEIN